jgi:hypothetical protein
VPATTPDGFADIQKELEEIVSKLKTTHDAKTRIQLLREMRLLLAKAERSS